MSNYPYKNLVLRGGGILGIAYLGALRVLDEEGILPNIKRVSGASAGAITALATSICKTAAEIKELADTLDFKKVPDKRDGETDEEENKIFDDLACVKRLVNEYGWYTSDYFYGWLKKTIEGKFNQPAIPDELKNKDGYQTFMDFKKAGFRDLFISVTNISKHRNEIFSVETTPGMPVADAVRKSMSIPLYFEAINMDGDYYADGGTVNNYPMEVFDLEKYTDDKINFVDGINMETLGCHLFTSEASAARKEAEKKKKPKDNLARYMEDLFLTLLQIQIVYFNKTPNLIRRSAKIDDLGISAVDFSIEGDSQDPMRNHTPLTKYDQLYRSGYFAMQDYLKKPELLA